jgi:predicted RND superfamily exporter protein
MSFSALLARLTAASYRHPARFLGVALAITVVGAFLASGLEIRSSFEDLLPTNVPSVRHAKELAKRVGGDGTVLVSVEALEGPQDLEKAEALASKLADEYRALGPDVIRSVETNVRSVQRWYEDHWPLFLPLADIEKAHDTLVRELGKAKAKVNPLLDLTGDEEEAKGPPVKLDEPLLDPAKPSPRQQVEQRFERYPGGYMVHPDQRSVTIVVRPTGTSLGVGEARALLDKMHAVTNRHQAELAAGHLRVGFAGTFPIMLAEYEAIIGDVVSTFALVVFLVLASILVFYREVRPVLALGAAIMVAVAATFGITRLVIGYLNTQTAFLGSIVAGNGINYGLVYLARLGQVRRKGTPLPEALHEGARAAARATLLAAVATSVSFGTLLIASNRGFRHFGFIGGVGMIFCWAATFALVPALLAVFERIRPVRYKPQVHSHGRALAFLERAFSRPRAVVVAFAALTAVSLGLFLWRLPEAMERNLDNLGNDVKRNPVLKRDNDRANTSLGQSITGVVALLPSREGAEEYCRQIDLRIKETPRLGQLIQGCETISTIVPADQEKKLALLRDIGERLTPGVLSRLPPEQAERAREIRRDLMAQQRLRVEDAPASLVDRFREHDGTVGRLAFARATPNAKLELGPNLREFVDGVRDVPVFGEKYDAAGETVVIADLLADIEREGPRTTLLSFLCVCVLTVVFLRSFSRSARLLLALAVGVVLMGGVAAAIDLKINFFNFIVYPITFGIAVDYGANVLARINARRSVVPALLEVGPAVALCSWTTIIGYGSLLFSINRALRSFGWYAMLGEVTCILTALTLLPAFALVFPPRAWKEAPAPRAAARAVAGGSALTEETPHAD